MKKNSEFRIFKWAWILLIFLTIILFSLLTKKDNSKRLEKQIKKICFHRNPKKDIGDDATRFLTEWECDYCGEVIDWGGNHPKPNQTITRPILNSLAEKHLFRCENAREFISMIDSKKDKNWTYDDEFSLRQKGYQDTDKIKNWLLINRVNLPNLKDKKRVGIVNQLNVVVEKTGKITDGYTSQGLVFLTPRATPITQQNLPKLLKKKQKPDPFYFPCRGGEKYNLYEKIVVNFFIWKIIQKEGYWDYNVFSSIVNQHKFMPMDGESGTLSLYLSLLSAYHRKPISKEVAATGFIDVGNYSKLNYCPWCFQEEIKTNAAGSFSNHKISQVGGLEYKVPSAVKSGVKKLIFSTEQKEDYEKTVPEELKKQLTVYYVNNVEELELEELFWNGEFS